MFGLVVMEVMTLSGHLSNINEIADEVALMQTSATSSAVGNTFKT
jgi:hypothetical protein